MHIPLLIHDLALMLLVAGVITLVFKKFKQPLVLGYIITGFLVGPYFDLFPAVEDSTSIETWSEIGIIILMFALGLEFNLLKLFSVGKTALVTAVTEVLCMFGIGYICGVAFGWTTIASVFLGCMLSMSSTTIIIKAFDDLELKGEEFTEAVFGTLIVEDIAGIFMMVVFSTMAVSQGVSGGELTMSLVKMGFYLVLWLILGILLIPTFIKKTANFMSDETLTIISMGICFGMVLLAHYLGFSSALGAFLAGSLLAGTDLSQRIEEVTKSNKDLFGAVFFISVGMMVDPAKIVSNLGIIVVLTLLTIFGKSLFSTAGVFISGKPLYTAIQSGASLAQIGEFSFIIASLGISLGMIDQGVYPVIVSVSVITTFTTPYVIKSSEPFYKFLKKIMPDNVMEKLDRKGVNDETSETDGDMKGISSKDVWKKFIKTYLIKLLVDTIILLGIILGGIYILWPFLCSHMPINAASILSAVVVIAAASPFLKQTSVQRNRYFVLLWVKNKKSHIRLMFFTLLSTAVMLVLIAYTLNNILSLGGIPLILITLILVAVITYLDQLSDIYHRLAKLFMSNLGAETEKHDEKHFKWIEYLTDDDLHANVYVSKFYYENLSPLPGIKIEKMIKISGARVRPIIIERGGKTIRKPTIKKHLADGDAVYMIGYKNQLDLFYEKNELIPDTNFDSDYIPVASFAKYRRSGKSSAD